MGKSSPSPPPAPDYTGAAKQTAAGNLEAAKYATEANRVNTYTPYGNLTYSKTGDNTWQSNVSLAPAQQQLLDQQNRTSAQLGSLQDTAASRVGGAFGQAIPGAYQPGGQAQSFNANSIQSPDAYDPNQATNNASDLINARLLPQQQRDKASLDTQLANQGITAGSEAYKNAEDQLGRTQNDARQQAQLEGISLGQSQQAQSYGQRAQNNQDTVARQAQMFGQQIQNLNQNQSQQAQQYAQATANRNIPINELNALRTGAQVTNPTFQNAPQQGQTAGADLLGAAGQQNQYNMGLYNSQVGQNNANLGLFGSLAGAGAVAF